MTSLFLARKFKFIKQILALTFLGAALLFGEIPEAAQAAVPFQQGGGNGNAIKAFGGNSSRNVNLEAPASPIGSGDLGNGQFTLKGPKDVLQRDNFNKPPDPVDTNGNLDIPPATVPLAISPLAVPLGFGGQQVFSAIGGVPPYMFSVVADATGGATVNATTGLYTAGPNVGTSRVRVTDSNLETAEAGVTVVAFGLTPFVAVLAPGASQQFSGISGTPPYTFSLQGDTTGGASVNSTTGLYMAGPNAGTSTVRVTDSNLETADAGITVQTTAFLLSQSPWTVQSFSSQLSSAQGAAMAIDGNSSTKWRTGQSASPPHNLQINLGTVFEIEGFNVLPETPTEGVMTSFYEFYVSEDGVSWGEPVAAGELANLFTEREVRFPRVAGRYVRLRPLGEHNGRNFIILAELNVVGAAFSGNFASNGTINTPTSNVTINAGSSVSFSGTFTDSNGHSALSYLWDFGDPTLPDSTQEDPGSVVFTTPGTYTVTFQVTDTFGLADPYPDSVTVKVLAGSNTTLPRDNWTIKFVNSEEVNLASNVAENVLDGNASTIWQTQFNDVGRPHDIQINLGSAYRLDALRYLPPASSTGRILAYHIYISQDGAEWGAPVAIGSFSNSSAEQRVAFPPKTGQFVRVVALTTNGSPTAAMAEVNLEGQCDTPFVELIEPLTQEVQAGSGLQVTASVCLAQPVHAGWGVRLSVDGGAQQQTIPFPSNGQITPTTFQRTFTGISGDNHQVDAVIVNNTAAPVAGADTSDSVTNVGVGDVYAAIGDSTTVGVGDDDDTDAISQDGRNTNTGRGFIPALNNILTAKLGRPHDILNFGYSGESSAGALIRTPKFLRVRPRDTVFLIALGINDANSGLVPSGQGLNPGDSGYSGTFKANLQALIDLFRDSSNGRTVYLAKVSFLLSPPRPPSVITDLIAYNVAIDELVVSNGITVVPPDLFTFFQTNPSQLQADGIHPTGSGHKSVSTLWCVAITGGTCPAP